MIQVRVLAPQLDRPIPLRTCVRDGTPTPVHREIEETSYLAVGRKYGVSDNAIRKWVRQYEREAELRQERGELGEAA